MKKVLITGLTGLVGSGLFSFLKDDEKYEIVAICRENSDVSFIKDKCQIEYGSISNVSFLNGVFIKYKFDMIVHIANKALIVRFAKLAKQFGVKEVVLVSSTYACSKKHPDNRQLKLENEAESILKSYDSEYVFLRPTSIFGSRPNGIKDKNISEFTKWCFKYPLFPLFGRGKAEVCPIWGKDVGLALYIIIKNIRTLSGQRLICSGDKKRTFKELILLIGGLNNKNIRFLYIPGWVGRFVINTLYFLSFKRFDKREQIDRLLEDKYFESSKELVNLGFVTHSFEKAYLVYNVSKKVI